MATKEEKERLGREHLERVIREHHRENGKDISSREVDKVIQRIQERTDKEGKLKAD